MGQGREVEVDLREWRYAQSIVPGDACSVPFAEVMIPSL